MVDGHGCAAAVGLARENHGAGTRGHDRRADRRHDVEAFVEFLLAGKR